MPNRADRKEVTRLWCRRNPEAFARQWICTQRSRRRSSAEASPDIQVIDSKGEPVAPNTLPRSLEDNRVWTPTGLQNGVSALSATCKSLKGLVGLPGFEPGTSCTPNSGSPFIGCTDLWFLFGLHGFGPSASAHRRWPGNHLTAHFCAQFSGPLEHLRGGCFSAVPRRARIRCEWSQEVCLSQDAADFTEDLIEWREGHHLISQAHGPECLQSWFLLDDRLPDSEGLLTAKRALCGHCRHEFCNVDALTRTRCQRS